MLAAYLIIKMYKDACSSSLIPTAVSSIAFNTLSTLCRTVSSGRPNLFAATRQCGHWFLWFTGHQTLLRMICNIGAHLEYMMKKSVSAHYLYTIFPSSLEGLEKWSHAVMKDLIPLVLSFPLQEALQLCHWNITSCSSGGWSAHGLVDIADGEVNRPHSLIPIEIGQMGLVRCNDHRSNGCSFWRMFLLQALVRGRSSLVSVLIFYVLFILT